MNGANNLHQIKIEDIAMKLLIQTVLIATLGVSAFNANAAHVLIVLSDENHLDLKDGKEYKTGFFLNELMQPTKMLIDAGHTITFATPEGKVPALDVNSNNAMYFNNDTKSLAESQQLLDKLKITSPSGSPFISLAKVKQMGYDKFDAVYIPGGHAPMQDLLKNKKLGQLLTAFHQAAKPTALVCHGPIALLSTLSNAPAVVQKLEQGKAIKADPKWIYNGYKMTVFSNQEEAQATKMLFKDSEMKLFPQVALQAAGGSYSSNTAPWNPHVVTDRELITGQNPASAMQVGKVLLDKLQ